MFQSVHKPIFPLSVYLSMPKARLNISRTTGVLGGGYLHKLVKGEYGGGMGGTFTSGESRESLSLSRTNCAKQIEITDLKQTNSRKISSSMFCKRNTKIKIFILLQAFCLIFLVQFLNLFFQNVLLS